MSRIIKKNKSTLFDYIHHLGDVIYTGGVLYEPLCFSDETVTGVNEDDTYLPEISHRGKTVAELRHSMDLCRVIDIVTIVELKSGNKKIYGLSTYLHGIQDTWFLVQGDSFSDDEPTYLIINDKSEFYPVHELDINHNIGEDILPFLVLRHKVTDVMQSLVQYSAIDKMLIMKAIELYLG